MNIEPGQFVHVKGTPEQIGKCLGIKHGLVSVEWFYSVVDRQRRQYPLDRVSSNTPLAQTRCYWFNPATSYWETGRLVSVFWGQICIAFPEGNERTIPESDVYVRCHVGHPDALELMKYRFFETPYFHSGRAPLVQALTRQTATNHGLTSLLSSRIRLLDHQIDVIRRVLEDPVQRYLLADEVGLGKTIEAGVIVRQTFLDNPQAKALIVTPETLSLQWQREFAVKHGLISGAYSLEFATHGSLVPLQQAEYDIVVIDEAHHLAHLAYDVSATAAWRTCQELCHRSPRVLLLSATPALHREADFLAMLHLLEPQTYRMEDMEGFRARIRNREGVATTLDIVQEGIRRRREIQEAVDALREYLADDAWVQRQADALEGAIAQPEAVDIDAAVRKLRIHICETHRIYRRMLRSSRRRISEDLIPKRSTGPLIIEWTTDPRAEASHYFMDNWREAALLSGADGGPYRKIFHAWLSLSTTWTPLLREALLCRLGEEPAHSLKTEGSGVSLIETLTAEPLFDGERDILRQWSEDLEGDQETTDQIDNLLEVLRHYRTGRHVVFSAYTGVAEEIVRRLGEIMNPAYIYAFLATTPVAERDALLDRFSSEKASAVLVCDQTGEEGLNLQFVDRIFHFDLPWEPNRLEQRVGRVDRIGRIGSGAPMHVFLPEEPDDSFSDAYLRVLRDGVGIFRSSAADLQFLLDREGEALVHTAFLQGATAVKRKVNAVRRTVESERRALRQQSALDELDAYETDEFAFAASLREEDQNAAQFQASLDRWIYGALNFKRGSGGSGFVFTERTLLPRDRWRFVAEALPQGHDVTFSREAALARADVELMRQGHPFMDRLLSYMDWEDRGQVFALWRELKEEMPNESGYFRFDFIVELDPRPLERATPHWDDVRRRPLLRQAVGWRPPDYQTVFIDVAMAQPVTDRAILELLKWDYKKVPSGRATDTNLGRASRIPVIADVVPDYPSSLDACYHKAVLSLKSDAGRMRDQERSVLKATNVLETRLDQLRRGLVYRGQTDSLEEENDLYEALLEGIKQPLYHLDAAGLIILSNRNPFLVGSNDWA